MTTEVRTLIEMLGIPAELPKLTDTAVIIVDAQREYLDGSVPLVGIEKALLQISELLSKARAQNVSIFHLRHQAPAGAPVFSPDSPYNEIVDSARPYEDEPVIIKHQPSGFAGTNLQNLLQATGKQHIVLAGFMTHMCIGATARGATEYGYRPIVVAAACATRDLPGPDGNVLPAETIHLANLASLSDLVATIAPASNSLR